jgi:BASS family bile acid:Na+ symporter
MISVLFLGILASSSAYRIVRPTSAPVSSKFGLHQAKKNYSPFKPIVPPATPVERKASELTNFFPAFVVGASIFGFKSPAVFAPLTPVITPALSLTMMTMGMTLSVYDFERVAKQWKKVVMGFFCQFTIMPLLAFGISKAMKLSPELAAGLILVGCAPGGTASNLVTLIAKADVALSVLMTAVSTSAAIFLTPALTAKLAGSFVSVPARALAISTMQVVLLPVLLGMQINQRAPKFSKRLGRWTPLVSALLIAGICGTISASNAAAGVSLCQAKRLLAAVSLLHIGGFSLGYLLPKGLLGATEQEARTIGIETGMQNSALASVLAQSFPNPVLTSLPGAISATVHSCIGSALAAFWRSK